MSYFYNFFVLFSNVLALHPEVRDYCVFSSHLSEGTKPAASHCNLRLCGGRRTACVCLITKRTLRLKYQSSDMFTFTLLHTAFEALSVYWHRGIRLVWNKAALSVQALPPLRCSIIPTKRTKRGRQTDIFGIVSCICQYLHLTQTVNKQKSLCVHFKSLFSIN